MKKKIIPLLHHHLLLIRFIIKSYFSTTDASNWASLEMGILCFNLWSLTPKVQLVNPWAWVESECRLNKILKVGPDGQMAWKHKLLPVRRGRKRGFRNQYGTKHTDRTKTCLHSDFMSKLFVYWIQKPVVNWHNPKSGQNVSCCVQNYDTVNCKYARALPAFYSSSCLILHKATTGSCRVRVFQQGWTKKCKLDTKSKSGLLVGATVQNVVCQP